MTVFVNISSIGLYYSFLRMTLSILSVKSQATSFDFARSWKRSAVTK